MATNQTRNWLGALVQRGVRLALVVPVLLSVSIANAWATPEINVTGNSRDIADGDTSSSVLDHTFFESVAHVSGTISRTFTIENTGTSTLTLGANAVTLSGTHAADFTVTSQPTTTVAASGSTSVTVLFDPSALGTRSATLSIANNDADENPYTFAISGTGAGLPEINVTGNGQNIVNGDTTPQAADHTDFGSIDIGNGDIERTFTVQNIGDARLTIGSSAVSISGPDAADFSVFTHPFSFIADGSSATTRIRFDPSTVGTKSATVTIPNDDADESPYSFAISGTATSAPEIEVRLDNGILVPNGSSHVGYRVDSLSFNEAFGERTYTINNVGSDTLTISNVTITGTHAAEFSVVTPPAATVAPGGSTTFTLRFTQTTSGTRNATINIINNDPDEGAFSFGTTGFRFSGPDPDVSGQGLDIANGDTTPRPEDDTDFGSADTASGFVEKSFTGANNGDSPLMISAITVTGAHASDFSVTTGTGFSPITVRFDPSADGLRTATVNIASDALVDNPFTFAIQGTGTSAAPEIGVSSSESGVVADGGTDAQGSEAAGSAKTVTYTVSNTGTDDLTLATATSSSLSNATVNAISAPALTTVPDGNSTTFSVQYTPTIAGAFSFDLAFTNNDGDENPYNMTISGTATGASEVAVSSSESGAVADGGTDAQGNEPAGAAKTVTYTVSNTGTDDLTLATATSSSLSNVTVNAISAPGATTVTPGNSTTFTVQYTPTIAGAFSFDLAFTNNDGNENPYNISLSGTATGTSEIAVSSSESGAVADAGTDAQGNEPAGTAKTVTYTVSNTGTDDLTLATATSSSLSNVTVNAISAPGATTVTPGNSTTFTVQYTPTLAGAFSFDLAFSNNDGDENPYNISVSGTATGASEVAVFSSEGGAVADGGTDAQGNEPAGTAKTVTYTVSNTGTSDLTLATATSSSLSNVSVNAISAPGVTTVTPGNSTTFTVQYTPTLAGAFSFDLAFTNNDGDENPYNISVSGMATGAPEIAVSSSESGVVADGGTDAQGAEVAGSAKTVTYTVSNTGTDDLTLATATSSSLSNVTVNAISAPASTTVTPGNATTFSVQYTPTLAGVFSFDLAFTNNDGDENPYNISVSGTATGSPEIAVSSSEGGAVTDGGTDAQGSEAAGSAKTVTYTVSNTGTDDLTLATATSGSLTNVTVNAISAPGAITVTPGNATTFTVQYTPTLAGAFSFDLAFTNNDGDENPYNVSVSGTATGSPEIAVSSSEGGTVADAGTDAQGSEPAGSAKTVTYTVSNIGTDDLTLATATSSSLSNVSVNSISAPASTTVTPGNSTTFTVQYTPTIAGAFSFDLAFTNNDGDENPFNITVSGTGTGSPEVAVSSSEGGSVADGGTDAQGSEAAGAAKTLTYTVSNTGTDDLTLATATSSGPTNVTVNSISAPATTTVTPGNSTTFTVQYTPTIAGAFSFGLAFTNNDGDENPYNISVSGTATGSPEIAVSSSEGGAVTDGGTDAQGSEAAGSAKTVTYTVSNTGTDDLTLATATSGSLTNVTVNAISAPGVTTVTPGNATTFTVQYTPTLAGAFSFNLAFTNSDGDENPYNISVSGTATGSPEIAVSSSEGGTVADAGSDAQGSEPAGTAKTVTYTVSNTGTDDLTLATASSSSLSNVAVNAISAPGAITVTPGNATTFTVQYTPTLAGVFSFDLAFTNNDGDENPYNISVSGTATGASEVAVSSSEGGAVADSGTDAQGSEAAGSAKTVTYTVSNTGTDDLTLATVTSSSLSNVTVDSISAPGLTTVTAGNSTTFTVQYTPTLAGAFSFDLAFTNNDGDESPYNMTVSGTATGAPEIAVSSSESGAVADGGTDAQGSEAAGSAKTVTYTVSNTGTDDLTLATATSSSLSNVSVNSISAPASTTVTPGNSTTFTVQYTPTIAGSFSFGLAFTNNDGDENPFNITVSGTGTGSPEVAVSSSEGGSVADGGTDAQGSEAAGSAKTLTYTVSNTGTDDLTLATATSSGPTNVTVNSISAPATTTVTPGNSTTFTVQYTPTLEGVFSFDLAFTNNDGDENPYNISVSGTGAGAPEINVRAGVTTPIADNPTHDPASIGGTRLDAGVGGSSSNLFTIENTGTGTLTLGANAVSLSGVGAGDFSVSQQPAASVSPGGSTTFRILFSPSVAGVQGPIDVAINNNDVDESPYNFRVQGTGRELEINLTGNGQNIADNPTHSPSAGDHTDFGSIDVAAGAVTRTFTVENNGFGLFLTLGANAVSLSGAHAGDFSVTTQPANSVDVGLTTTFQISFDPSAAGVRGPVDVSIANDDPDEAPYNFRIQGTGAVAPEINVTGNGQRIADGDGSASATDHTDFGSADITSGTVSRTFTIENTGSGTLTLGANAASLSGTHAGDFTVTSQPAASVAASGSTSVTVQFDPSALGARNATLSIASDDADEAVYDFALSGTGAGMPEISVSSSESGAVADGGMDAQWSEAAGVAKTVTYTITNSGTDDLTLAQATSSSLSNVVLNSISAPGSTTVTSGGGTTTFTVQYTPTIAGAFSFALAFTNNDGDESPYNFTVSGTGAGAPEIAVLGNGQGIADGDTTPASADHTDFASNDITSGAVSRTFTIQNTGTDVLNLGANAASLSGTHASDFTVSAQPATSLAPGGSTSVTVQFDPSNLGIRTAVLTVANDDADENPYDFTLTGQGISGGTITIVQNITGDDVSVGFSSTTPALNFSLTSVSGVAQTSLAGVPVGAHTLVAEDLAPIGYGVSSIACDDADSTGDVVNRTATINLTSGEHVTCVFETIDTRGPTTQMIADFLGARNTLLLFNQPGSDRRINRLKGGTGVAGGDSFQAFGHNLRSPLPGDVSVSEDSFSFATSLKRVMAMGGEASLAANDNQNEGEDPLPLDIWIEGSASRFIDGDSGGGSFGLLSFGVDYLVEPDLLIGFMGQLDRFKQDFTTPGSEIDGRGWMAGPYATLKLDEHLYLDVLGAWGRSDNDISPFGTYTDSFETDRWLVSSTLTGQFDVGNWDLRPSYTLQFFHERQFAYTDTLGVRIPEQSLSQGDMRLGPQIAYTQTFEDGSQLTPKGGFEGIYSFGARNTFSAGSFAAETQGLTGQVNAGLDYQTPGGLNLGLTTDYGGIGGTAKSFGLSVQLSMPLN